MLSLPRIIRDAKFVVLDIESTGLSTKKDEPVQLAFGHMDNGLAGLRGFYTIKPGVPIQPRAAAIHGFTEQKLTWAPDFGRIASEVRELLAGRIVLGYNAAKFDVPMLSRMLASVAARADEDPWHPWQPPVLDVLLWQRHFARSQGWSGGNGLAEAAARWGVDVQNLHDAWRDCRVTWALFWALASKFPELGDMDPLEALARQAAL